MLCVLYNESQGIKQFRYIYSWRHNIHVVCVSTTHNGPVHNYTCVSQFPLTRAGAAA